MAVPDEASIHLMCMSLIPSIASAVGFIKRPSFHTDNDATVTARRYSALDGTSRNDRQVLAASTPE